MSYNAAKTLRPFLVLFFLFLLLMGCGRGVNTEEAKGSQMLRVGLIKLGDHPVINEVVSGFNQRIKTLLGERVVVKVADGKFDAATVADLASRIVAGNFDLIISVTTPATLATIGANRGSKEHIFTFVSDLDAIGYTGKGSLRNVCGLSDVVNYEKTLQLIKSVLPRCRKVGMIATKSEPNAVMIMEEFKQRAPKYDLRVVSAEISEVRDLHFAIKTLSAHVDAFLFGGDNTLAQVLSTIIEAAKQHSKPIFACDKLSVLQGAIAAYSVDYLRMGERTAEFALFLKAGVRPEDIDVERFVASRLVVNIDAARAFGVDVSSVVMHADEVIGNGHQ